mmetsp:Transcript_56813/g.99023  ORF Transcript_56813/g.99023 Transcript_56813/m.99023 type:complete len:615 (+) Transcript_56813:87-1931(+)
MVEGASFSRTLSRSFTRAVSWYPDGSQKKLHLGTPASEGHLSDCLVIPESNAFRKFFAGVVILSLVYTGTVFPFRLCFLEFRIPYPHHDEQGWLNFEMVVDCVFYIDLVINFFFSYRDGNGQEVRNLKRIALEYLKGYFVINFVACIPPSVVGQFIHLFTDDTRDSSTVNKGFRIGRVQRISRIARLTRLARLVKLAAFLAKSSAWRVMQSLKGILVVNFITGLLWIVHMVACGWYLCASLHTDHTQTWVGRRSIGSDDNVPLFDAGPFEQWCHAMYFVLTVFTTVGFGDMSAETMGEIAYVCFTMLIGAVVHGIIVSEMINVVMRADQAALEVNAQKDLVAGFSRHTEIPPGLANDLQKWVMNSRGSRHGYDRAQMRSLLTSAMPQEIMRQLPERMFDGKLVSNKFITSVIEVGHMPSRFPVLVALMLHRRNYEAGEIVYYSGEHPFSLFLVYEGTFANIGTLGPDGGVSDLSPSIFLTQAMLSDTYEEAPTMLQNIRKYFPRHQRALDKQSAAQSLLHPYQLFGAGNYFGDTEILEGGRRISSVRCESKKGSLLLLHKTDFQSLCNDFPSFKPTWQKNCTSPRSEATRAIGTALFKSLLSSIGSILHSEMLA